MAWIGRITTAVLAVLLVGLIGFNVFKDQIAWTIFHRVINKQAGVDRSAALPDGLHVYLCGTGSPMADASRAGPCIGILAGDQAFVVDVGSGGVRNLGSMGFPFDKLETVYLTHLHSDHIDGLGELLLMSWIGGQRSEQTPITGPVGTAEVVAGFNGAYRLDSTYRIAHHGTEVANPNGYGGLAQEIEVPIGLPGTRVLIQDKDLTITAIRVDHTPVEPAFGYRIDYKDRSISISGDTVYHPGFIAASKGVDVMLHEALNRKMVSTIGAQMGERGFTNGEIIFEDILDYHASPEEAARAAQEAEAGHLILYHLVPPLPVKLLEGPFLGDSKSLFDGKITVGRDRMLFTLPAGSTRVEITK